MPTFGGRLQVTDINVLLGMVSKLPKSTPNHDVLIPGPVAGTFAVFEE